MKILMLLTKLFRNDPRVYNEAKALVDAGHDVLVLDWARHDTDKKLPQQETIDGIMAVYIHNTRLINMLPGDVFRNPVWWRTAYRKALELHKSGEFRFDAVHCHDLDTLQAGVWLKKKLGVKLVYDAHEIFGYMIEKDYPAAVSRAAFWMEKRLLSAVDCLITVNAACSDYFTELIGMGAILVDNCKTPEKEYLPPTRDQFTVIYIGVLSSARFFPQALDVVGHLDGVRMVIGAKREALYDEVEEIAKRYPNIEFLGPVPGKEVLPITRECHCILCMFDPSDRLNRIGSPNKLFEAMATGRPIIVTKGTHAGDVAESEQCGLAIEYSAAGLAGALEMLRNDPALCERLGRNGLSAAKREYNWQAQANNLVKLYGELE